MQLKLVRNLIKKGPFAFSDKARNIDDDISNGIRAVQWPPGSGSFTLNSAPKGNGVKPIKLDFIAHLKARGWKPEQRMSLSAGLPPGNVDVVLELAPGVHFAVEWETGNISSTHRALNKIASGLSDGCLAGGALVLPSRAMYPYLTDRIGSYEEIEPYLSLYSNMAPQLKQGVLSVYVVEQDSLSSDVAKIPKGTDGRSRG